MAVNKQTYVASIKGSPASYIFTNITVGTPPQLFSVIVDAGSSDLWVPAQNEEEGEEGGPGIFDGSASSTYQSSTVPFSASYVGGETDGFWATDTIEASGVTLSNYQFGVMNQMQNQNHGVLGVSFKEDEMTARAGGPEYTNFPFALKDQGYIDHVIYSLHFKGPHSPDGTLLFGGIDHAKYSGDLHYYPVPDPGNGPQIAFDSLLVNGATKIDINSLIVLDSGSPAILFPDPHFGEIAKALKLTDYVEEEGFYHVDCKADMSVDFQFDGVTISANSSSLVLPSSFFTGNISDSSCAFAIQNMSLFPSAGNNIMLGEPFLKNAYVVYDLENYQIGLAPAIYTDNTDVQVV